MEKNNNYRFLIFILFFIILLTGCHAHIDKINVTGLKASAYPMEDKEFEIIEAKEAWSSSFHLLWTIPVTVPADYYEAIDQAINDEGGDNMIDVRYWHEKQYWLVGKIDIFHVRGKVIRYIEE